MTTIYPERLDTDLEIRRIDDDVTEMGGDVINSLRDAVFAIENAVGIDPQGNKASLVDRINISIDDNGNIKRSALENQGLVTLPIANRHIADNAAIAEEKLDLDYGTITLKNLIDSLRTDMTAAQNSISNGASQFSSHILGLGYFHDGYQIKIDIEDGNGVAGLAAETIGDAINELSTILLAGDTTRTPHIDLSLSSSVKHRASEVSVNTINFESIDRSVTSVQQAFDSIDSAQGILGIAHIDSFHANGILKDINSGTFFNENRLLLGPVYSISYTENTSVIKIPGVTSFSALGITAGSILEIVDPSLQDAGTYQIRATGPIQDGSTLGNLPVLAADELAVFHIFLETLSASEEAVANIYEPTSISSEGAPLACVVRNNQTIVDTISILPPDAARVVSVGFNSSILNADGYDITVRVGIGQNNFRELTIPDLNLERLGTNQAHPVDAKSVAERINAYVSNPDLGFNFPITAYKIGNEIAIAHNLVGEEFTIEILDGYTGNFALGLDAYGANVVGNIIAGNINNIYTVNGVSLSSLRTAFDGYAEISSGTDTFVLWTNEGQMANPLHLGMAQGSVIHITEHPTLDTNGSYTLFAANSTTVSLFGVEPIDAPTNPTRFNVLVSDSNIPLSVLESSETDNGIVEFYVDSDGKVLVHERLSYGTGMGPAVEIIDISNNFPVGNFTVNIDATVDKALFTFIDDSLPGETVTIDLSFKGTFKLYHPNNIEYIWVKVTAGTIIDATEIVAVQPSLNYDEAFQICALHFNGTLSITNNVDKRFFGNISANQVRDDFIELFSQRPVADLRSDGVVRGFDVLDIPFVDSITEMQALPLRGGVAYVNGVRVTVETQKVIIPSYDEEGTLFSSVRRVIGINEFGSIRVFSDELGELLSDGYNASAEFGKILPLYQILMTNGTIDDVVDVRLFINNLDSKLELIVDETNNVVGNFRSLEGALLFASSYPHKEHLTIKIINSVYPNAQVVVPNGISIIGGAPWGGDSRHQIINSFALGDSFLVLSGNNRLENVEIISELATTNGALIEVAGRNVNIEKCLLRFGQSVTSVDSDIGILVEATADQDVRIVNNKIDTVYSGIASPDGCDRIIIRENIITNLAGTGIVADGIRIGSASRIVSNVVIADNIIKVPSVVATDIRGISIDVGNTIEELRIEGNSIVHSAFDTMTNGIRIENEAVTGDTVTRAFIINNLIIGVALEENDVWGIYISSVEDAKITQNIISDMGDTFGGTNIDVACIGIGDAVGYADITDNTLRDCDVTRGIEVTSGGQVNISGNTLNTLGEFAYYINGNATGSTVTNNILIGPGTKGIKWTGTNSKISDNNMSQPDDASDYAFKEHAIYIQTSDVDIKNNTITGMVYNKWASDNVLPEVESIGISNVSASRDRMKIVGNTIAGNRISKSIELFSTGHVVSNNRIINDEDYSGGTVFIEFNDVSGSFISNNMMSGTAQSVFLANDGLDTSTIVNNNVDAKDTSGGSTSVTIGFDLEIATNCFIFGNRMPLDGSPSTTINYIGTGIEADFGATANNSIGHNAGIVDIRNLPVHAASSAFTSAIPHWALGTTLAGNEFMEVSNTGAATRYLYFPITDIPNGVFLLSVHPQGKLSSGTITTQVFRKQRITGFTKTAISSSTSVTGLSSPFYFGFPTAGVEDSNGSTPINLSTDVINHFNNSYYALISHTGSTAGVMEIHGLAVKFRY